MRRLSMTALTIVATLALAACSGASTPAPPNGGGSGAAACSESKAAGAVGVTIVNSAYSTSAIAVKVGQVVAFTNKDSSQHTASLDDSSCTTATLNQGETDGLAFSAPGSYPFHCNIHPTMKGTFTISS
jgi:plastocyanin